MATQPGSRRSCPACRRSGAAPNFKTVLPLPILLGGLFTLLHRLYLQSYDLSVAKNFTVTERFRLRFQTDFFNAFNVANFTSPDVNVSDKAFGTLASAYPPRNLQMALKLTF